MMNKNQIFVKEEAKGSTSIESVCVRKKRDRRSKRNLENSTVVRAKTILIQSSTSSGRAQPSDSPLCAHYSNEKSNSKARKRRKGTAAPTILEYNIHYIPRILKNDLRRQYPMIFTNVFNSCDVNQIKSLLQTFCRPDLRNIMEFSEPFALYQRTEAYGFKACEKEFLGRMIDAPDNVFSLNEVQMKVKSDGTCKLHSKFELRGTKIIYMDPRRIMNIILRLLSYRSTFQDIHALIEAQLKTVLRLPFTPEPPASITSSSHASTTESSSPSSSSSVKSMPVHEPLSVTDDPPDEYLIDEDDLLDDFDEESCEEVEDVYDHLYSNSDDHPLNSEESCPIDSETTITNSDHEEDNNTADFWDHHEEKLNTLKTTTPTPTTTTTTFQIPQQQSDYEYIYHKFNDAMRLDRDNLHTQRTPEETLAIAVPYNFQGDFILHTDLESKVYLTHFMTTVHR